MWLLLFVALINFVGGENEEINVTIKQEILKGKVQKSRNGSKYYAFLSIPYAKPPIGELRFEPPQEPESWGDDIRDATTSPPMCFQKDIFTNRSWLSNSEDCLYLNVYTSEIGGAGLPVMVYIHGGAFIIGSESQYQPDYILDKPVVLVIFNYRLGVFGFLSAADDVISGNFGLKDQVAALRWVKKNIAAFSGDPNQVTLFGESAGGTSVDLHLHSPLSTGLFHRAIIQSGSALSYWIRASSLAVRQKAFALGLLIGYVSKTT